MTQLAEELQTKMPYQTASARLAVCAAEALRVANRNVYAAQDRFAEAVIQDAAMLAALMTHDEIRARALQYLQRLRADMVRMPEKMDGGKGQCGTDAQQNHALSPSASLPRDGQKQVELLTGNAKSRQPHEGGEGREQRDAQSDGVPPSLPHDSGGGHPRDDRHVCSAPAAVANPPRGLSAISAIQGVMAKHIIFRLQDGRDIMEAQFHELEKIERKGFAYTREAIVARYLREHVTYANPDPFAKVGDLFPMKTLELAKLEAEKAHV